MMLSDWISVLYLLCGIPAAFMLVNKAYRQKSLMELYYGLGVTSFLIGVTLTFLRNQGVNPDTAREWGDMIGVILALCALFVRIRNSKPVFARFPEPLTALPLIIIIFYPMIDDAYIIKNMLMMTFEAGAIIVGILMISINHYLHKNRLILIGGITLFTLSYVFYWYLSGFNESLFVTAAQIFLAVGMIVSAIGFNRINEVKN